MNQFFSKSHFSYLYNPLRGLSVSRWVFLALLFMSVFLLYVWSHVNMTRLEYKIAEAMEVQVALLEEQKRLKLEIARLKSPRRISAIAQERLGLGPPSQDQIILIRSKE
ncbi:MAG: cell division protein FtsL [Syntrophales bacterium]|nr:cell division protein FtsL [Syntrophales bacterium]